MYIVVGLGNPGSEYARTRHNTGKMAGDFLKEKVSGIRVIDTGTYMNLSGRAVSKALSSKKDTESLIVIYDDIDLPIGSIKISYNRGSGGHNGIESIVKALGTKEFIRIRIGIVPTNIFGKMKKPKGEKEVERFILGEFKKSEMVILEKVFEKITEAVEMIKERGLQPAMTEFNK